MAVVCARWRSRAPAFCAPAPEPRPSAAREPPRALRHPTLTSCFAPQAASADVTSASLGSGRASGSEGASVRRSAPTPAGCFAPQASGGRALRSPGPRLLPRAPRRLPRSRRDLGQPWQRASERQRGSMGAPLGPGTPPAVLRRRLPVAEASPNATALRLLTSTHRVGSAASSLRARVGGAPGGARPSQEPALHRRASHRRACACALAGTGLSVCVVCEGLVSALAVAPRSSLSLACVSRVADYGLTSTYAPCLARAPCCTFEADRTTAPRRRNKRSRLRNVGLSPKTNSQ